MHCATCRMPLAQGARFCSNCGTSVPAAGPPPGTFGDPPGARAAPSVAHKKARVGLVAGFSLVMLVAGVVPFLFLAKGCSSAEGSFASSGAPLGDFTLVPTKCNSGEHEGFYGVFLVPEEDNRGGIKLVQDPVKNQWVVHVELPGSCTASGCKVATLDPSECTTYDARVVRTNTTVNDIRLLDGHLHLACKPAGGGSISANLRFESCD